MEDLSRLNRNELKDLLKRKIRVFEKTCAKKNKLECEMSAISNRLKEFDSKTVNISYSGDGTYRGEIKISEICDVRLKKLFEGWQ